MTLILINIVSWILAAVFKAVMDTLNFRYKTSIFSKRGHVHIDHEYFWNPAVSWRNKYKNRVPERGPRFPGSTTVFVFLTDAWHLAQFFCKLMVTVCIVTALLIDYNQGFWGVIIALIAYGASFSVVFEACFSKIFCRKVKNIT